MHNEIVQTAGWGLRFEFGHHNANSEGNYVKGTYDLPTLHSTCKTTEESPVGSRFRSCDTIEVGRNEMLIHKEMVYMLIIV